MKHHRQSMRLSAQNHTLQHHPRVWRVHRHQGVGGPQRNSWYSPITCLSKLGFCRHTRCQQEAEARMINYQCASTNKLKIASLICLHYGTLKTLFYLRIHVWLFLFRNIGFLSIFLNKLVMLPCIPLALKCIFTKIFCKYVSFGPISSLFGPCNF